MNVSNQIKNLEKEMGIHKNFIEKMFVSKTNYFKLGK